MIRVGIGYDVHPLSEGRKLILGGVLIPHPRGLAGHSDADVLLHAVCDALLGAMGAGDLGMHFPDTDPRYKDVSSLVLLDKVVDLMRENGYQVQNIDTIILAEQPKIAPHRDQIRTNLAKALRVSETSVSVKATTQEGLGFVGRREGIAAQAICALVKA
jgi:2-C-methyl-D-erythritol 2,4-cyclodiphosphate synthase